MQALPDRRGRSDTGGRPVPGANGSHAKVFASTARWSLRSCARNRHSTCGPGFRRCTWTDAVGARNRRIYRPEKVPRKRRNQLYEPALNISLGQRYIRHLLKRSHRRGPAAHCGSITAVRTSANGNGGRARRLYRCADVYRAFRRGKHASSSNAYCPICGWSRASGRTRPLARRPAAGEHRSTSLLTVQKDRWPKMFGISEDIELVAINIAVMTISIHEPRRTINRVTPCANACRELAITSSPARS